jgi:hypothetical protein
MIDKRYSESWRMHAKYVLYVWKKRNNPLGVATVHTWTQCKCVSYFLGRRRKYSSQQIIRNENETHVEIETTLGKRKEQIFSEHVEPEVKKLKINAP